MADNQIEIAIKAIDEASGPIEGIVGALTDIGGAAIAAAGIAAAALGAGLGIIAGEAMKAQDADALFNAVIERSPLDKYKQQLIDIADAKSKVTRYSDDEIIAADTVLARYQNLGAYLPQLSSLTLDFATFMGTDATSAALQLGKAFEDIGGGSLSLLTRSRILTKEQADQAKAMAQNGDAAGAQALVMGILQQKVGGLAETMGGTFQGKLDIFHNTLERMAETMGGPLLTALQPLLDKLVVLAQQVAPQLAQMFKDRVVPAIGAFVQWLLNPETIKTIEQFTSKLIIFVQTAATQFSAWWEQNGPMVIELAQRIAQFITDMIPVMVNVFGFALWAFGGIMQLFLNLDTAALNFLIRWNNFWDGVKGAVKTAYDFIKNLVDQISKWLEGIRSALGGNTGGQFNPLAGGYGGASGGYPFMGSFAGGGMVKVGETGTENVWLPSGSYIQTAGESSRAGGGSMTFVYSPFVSAANRLEAEAVLSPVIRAVVRKMRAEGSV